MRMSKKESAMPRPSHKEATRITRRPRPRSCFAARRRAEGDAEEVVTAEALAAPLLTSAGAVALLILEPVTWLVIVAVLVEWAVELETEEEREEEAEELAKMNEVKGLPVVPSAVFGPIVGKVVQSEDEAMAPATGVTGSVWTKVLEKTLPSAAVMSYTPIGMSSSPIQVSKTPTA